MPQAESSGETRVTPLDRSVGRTVFGQDAAGYDAVRADYPAELFDRLDARCGGLAGRAAMEIGPGSGLATRALLNRDLAALTVFEPDGGMASYLRHRIDDRRLTIVDAPFGAAAAPACAYDLGLAAASFHWLDAATALADVARALRPDGQWAMWWNVYRTDSAAHPLAAAIRPLIERLPQPPSEQGDGHHSLDSAARLGALRDAGFQDAEFQLVRRDRTLSPGQVRALYASFSFVRSLEAGRRERLLDAITIIAQNEFGKVPSPILTAAYFATAPRTSDQ